MFFLVDLSFAWILNTDDTQTFISSLPLTSICFHTLHSPLPRSSYTIQHNKLQNLFTFYEYHVTTATAFVLNQKSREPSYFLWQVYKERREGIAYSCSWIVELWLFLQISLELEFWLLFCCLFWFLFQHLSYKVPGICDLWIFLCEPWTIWYFPKVTGQPLTLGETLEIDWLPFVNYNTESYTAW